MPAYSLKIGFDLATTNKPVSAGESGRQPKAKPAAAIQIAEPVSQDVPVGPSGVLAADDHAPVDAARGVGEPAVAPVKRRRRRGDDVRERVLAAALQCFGLFGFEGTSTREVAARANVTHTLVLYHFRSKDQLWLATLENALTPYLSAVHPLFKSAHGMPAAEALGSFIEIFVRMSAQIPEVHSILTREGNTDSDRLNWIIDHFLRDHFKSVCDIIRRGQAEGSVRQCDPARLYYLIISAGGTLPAIATEYRELTGRNVRSDPEILRNTAFIYEIVFN